MDAIDYRKLFFEAVDLLGKVERVAGGYVSRDDRLRIQEMIRSTIDGREPTLAAFMRGEAIHG